MFSTRSFKSAEEINWVILCFSFSYPSRCRFVHMQNSRETYLVLVRKFSLFSSLLCCAVLSLLEKSRRKLSETQNTIFSARRSEKENFPPAKCKIYINFSSRYHVKSSSSQPTWKWFELEDLHELPKLATAKFHEIYPCTSRKTSHNAPPSFATQNISPKS